MIRYNGAARRVGRSSPLLHAVAVRRSALVVVAETAREADGGRVRSDAEPVVSRPILHTSEIMAGVALKDVRVDAASEMRLRLVPVRVHGRSVGIWSTAKPVRLQRGHVHDALLTRRVSAVRAVVVHLLALELVLNALAVWRVADEREDGANAFDEEHALAGLSVVESGLYAAVAVRVAEELLETRAVQQLLDEHLACRVLGDADALLDDVRGELLNGEGTDIALELADNGVAEVVVVEVEDIMDNLHRS